LPPAEFADQQRDGPPEQAQGSAGRPLVHRPLPRAKHQLRTLVINAPSWVQPRTNIETAIAGDTAGQSFRI
jgi:hypothetical protein